MNFSIKEFTFGLIIFLVPTAIFLNSNNLKQLIAFDYFVIFSTLIFFLFFLIIISIFLRFAILKILNKKPKYIFLVSCFGFFLLYFYSPLQQLVKDLIFYNQKGSSYVVLIFLFLFWFVTLMAFINSQKFNLFFRRGIIIYAGINFLMFFISLIDYAIIDNNKQSHNLKKNTQDLINLQDYDLLISKNNLNKKNVYYIILDGMISIELAAQLEIINEYKTIKSLEESGITYISNSFSSYSNSMYSIASMMMLDYPINEDSPQEKYKNFYPMLMYDSKKKVQLPEIINKVGSQFYWIGNATRTCIEFINQPWNCTFPKNVRNFMRINSVLGSFYYNTPLKLIYYNTPLNKINYSTFTKLPLFSKFFPDEYNDINIGQRGIKYYINYLQKNDKNDKSKFVFLHQLSPHYPYTVDENCKERKYNEEYEKKIEDALNSTYQKKYDEESSINLPIDMVKATFEGYKASYKCVLKEILQFTSFIATKDPEALIVFQADHGTSIHHLSEKETETPNDDLWFRANIFNAIKAPKSCFKQYTKPQSTINTIRFALNCAYGFDLPYLKKIHFQVLDPYDQYYMGRVFSYKF